MNKGLKVLLITGGFVVMLGACAVLVYFLITQILFGNIPQGGNNPTGTPTTVVGNTTVPGITDEISPTEGAVVTPPSGWIAMDNTAQDYIAYRPGGWWFRFFSPNMETLGIDTNQIPEASEWAGIITLTRLNASNNFESHTSILEAGYTTSVQNIAGRNWTIVRGIIPANMLFDAQYAKYAYVNVGGREFLASIRSTAANFGGQESNFDTFISIINFY
jgi:hypothetical protein